jgi:hypothetical protein
MIPGKAHVGGGGGGDGMFAGMDPRLAAEAEKMWKALEDMSANDPAVRLMLFHLHVGAPWLFAAWLSSVRCALHGRVS